MNTRPSLSRVCVTLALTVCTAAAAAQRQDAPADRESEIVDRNAQDPTDVLGFTMTDIKGKPVDLEEFRGDVTLIVNVASKCGLTPQYEGLQALFDRYEERGFTVLGFPANDFGKQEPGTDSEILEFCTARFDVEFPMFSKIAVVGEERHPLYAKLAAATEDQGGEPDWNFTKYLVDRSGHVVKRFEPRTAPDASELIDAIETLLEAERQPAAPAGGDDR